MLQAVLTANHTEVWRELKLTAACSPCRWQESSRESAANPCEVLLIDSCRIEQSGALALAVVLHADSLREARVKLRWAECLAWCFESFYGFCRSIVLVGFEGGEGQSILYQRP